MLHGLLALDRRADVVVRLVPNEALEAIELRETARAAFTMLK